MYYSGMNLHSLKKLNKKEITTLFDDHLGMDVSDDKRGTLQLVNIFRDLELEKMARDREKSFSHLSIGKPSPRGVYESYLGEELL